MTARRLLLAATLVFASAIPGTAFGRQGTDSQIRACVSWWFLGFIRILPPGASCLPTETLIAWNVAGPTGPQGPAGPQGEPGRGFLTVVDSQGQRVGVLFQPPAVYINLNSVWQLLPGVTTNGINPKGGGVWFLTPDCTGPAYLEIWDALLISAQVLEGIIYSVGNNPRVSLQMNSFRTSNGDLYVCTDTRTGVFDAPTIVVTAAVPIPISSLGFVPPFRVVEQ